MEGKDVYKKKPFCVAVGWGFAGLRGREMSMSISLQLDPSASSCHSCSLAAGRKLDLERIRSFFCLCLTCFPLSLNLTAILRRSAFRFIETSEGQRSLILEVRRGCQIPIQK